MKIIQSYVVTEMDRWRGQCLGSICLAILLVLPYGAYLVISSQWKTDYPSFLIALSSLLILVVLDLVTKPNVQDRNKRLLVMDKQCVEITDISFSTRLDWDQIKSIYIFPKICDNAVFARKLMASFELFDGRRLYVHFGPIMRGMNVFYFARVVKLFTRGRLDVKSKFPLWFHSFYLFHHGFRYLS